MWEKMVGNRQGIILECNGRIPHEMVKGAVMCVNAKPVKKVPIETKKHKKSCIESCNIFVHTICKSKMFCFKHTHPVTRKDVSSAIKIMLKLVGVSAEVVLEENTECSSLNWGGV